MQAQMQRRWQLPPNVFLEKRWRSAPFGYVPFDKFSRDGSRSPDLVNNEARQVEQGKFCALQSERSQPTDQLPIRSLHREVSARYRESLRLRMEKPHQHHRDES